MKKGQPLGKPVERRNGAEGFSWEGIATKVDPAGAPSNRPRDLINTRIQGGSIISRPGFQGEGGYIPLIPVHHVNTPDVAERPAYEVQEVFRFEPHWMADHNWAVGAKLWLATAASASVIHFGFLDTDADNPFQAVATVPAPPAAQALWIDKFNNEFYFGDFGGLRKMYLVPSLEGAVAPPIDTDRLSDEVIVSYPGFATGFILEHEGKLFFATTAGAANGQIYSWDGLVVSPEFTMAVPGSIVCPVATYKDTIVVAVQDYAGLGQGSLLVRAATGVWSAHTLVGFQPTQYPTSIAEYGNLLYILDGTGNIFTWDGTTLALAHNIVNASEMNCCAKLAGRLYFAYLDNAARLELAYVDQDNSPGNEWVDIATRTGVSSSPLPPTAMAQYRGRLFIAGTFFGNSTLFWHSQQFTPFDGWQETQSTIAFTAGEPVVGGTITNMRTL